MQYKVLLGSILACCCLIAVSCTEAPFPVDEPIVRLQSAGVGNPVVFSVSADGGAPEAVDTLTVTNVRVLVQQVQIHHEGADTTTQYELLRKEPLLLGSTANGIADGYAALVAPSIYDAVRCTLYRLTDNEATAYASKAEYADFVTPERYSLILDGVVHRNNGTTAPFRYAFAETTTLLRRFDAPVGIPKGSSTAVVLQVHLPSLFLVGGGIIDPTITASKQLLDNRLAEAIRVAKRNF